MVFPEDDPVSGVCLVDLLYHASLQILLAALCCLRQSQGRGAFEKNGYRYRESLMFIVSGREQRKDYRKSKFLFNVPDAISDVVGVLV